jgi:hypothetical protein
VCIHVCADFVLFTGQPQRSVLHAKSEVHVLAVPRFELGFVFHVYIEVPLVECEAECCDVANLAQCVVSESSWIRELLSSDWFLLYCLELLALELLYYCVQMHV